MIEAVGIKLLSGKITVLNNYISTPGKGISIGTNRVLIETNHTFSMDYTNTTKTKVIRAPCDSNMKVYLADNNINVLSGDNEDVYGILAVTGNVTYKNNIVNVENITSQGSYDDLYELINNSAENSVIVLDRDYCAYGSCQCLEIDKNLTIDGNGHTIDYKHQAYTIHSTADNIVFRNLRIINAEEIMFGVIDIYDKSSCTLINCTFSNNRGYFGGVVHTCTNAKLKVVNCSFVNNSALLGGAIYTQGDLSVSNCHFSENSADNMGGVIDCYHQGYVRIEDSEFVNNKAKDTSVISSENKVNIINCKFINNYDKGRGIVYSKDIVTFTDNIVINNYSFIDLKNVIISDKRVVYKK